MTGNRQSPRLNKTTNRRSSRLQSLNSGKKHTATPSPAKNSLSRNPNSAKRRKPVFSPPLSSASPTPTATTETSDDDPVLISLKRPKVNDNETSKPKRRRTIPASSKPLTDWSNLPKDLLVLIARRIDEFECFIRFTAVCKSWQSAVSLDLAPLRNPWPWVMLTDIAEQNFPDVTKGMDSFSMLVDEVAKDEQVEGMHKRRFFSLVMSKVYEFELPEATRKKCLGLSHGWLLTVGFNSQINLLHPFSREQIPMPSLLTFPNQPEYGDLCSPGEFVSFFVQKAVISSKPKDTSNGDCIIMAIYGLPRVLAFARPYDKVWRNINIPPKRRDIYDRMIPKCQDFNDVVLYKGKFYAVYGQGVLVVDVNDVNAPKAESIASFKYVREQKYIVELSGSLMVVVRFRKGPFYSDEEAATDEQPSHFTYKFSIFKMVEDESSAAVYPFRFVEVSNLGDHSLFVGFNASFSLSSSKYVKPNCIYFSDDEAEPCSMQPRGGGPDTGIYDVGSGNIELHYASEFMSHLTPPLWYI